MTGICKYCITGLTFCTFFFLWLTDTFLFVLFFGPRLEGPIKLVLVKTMCGLHRTTHLVVL
jgi:hypothetical protein